MILRMKPVSTKVIKNTGLYFFLGLFLLSLSACGGGGDNSFSQTPTNPELPQATVSGQLLSAKIIKTESASISYKVKAYRIVYATPNTQNKMIRASGLLAIPQKALGEKSPLLSYQHGTTFLDKNAPSNSESTISGISKLASTGYIVSAPDFIGYGASAATIHPYIHASSLASASVDMLRAAKAFLSQQNIKINNQLFLTGYSEGGYATIALQKMLQEQYQNEFTVTASSAGAGPYDLTETAKTLANKLVNEKPSYMSFLLKAYNDVYGLNEISDMYQTPYVNAINRVFDGKHSGGEIDNQLNHETVKLFKADFLGALQNGSNHPIVDKLALNNLYDWKPNAPTRFYHSPRDETVPYANSQKAVQTMRNNGAQNISFQDCVLSTHVSCAGPYVFDTLVYFLRYAEDL